MNDTINDSPDEQRVGNRWRPFAIHLTLSLIILGAIALLLRHWFPGVLFETDGGWQALQIIAAVQIILGPLVTLVVAAPGKPKRVLRQDLYVIGALQAIALVIGTALAWDNRPCAFIWLDGDFSVVPWSSLREEPEALASAQALLGAGHDRLMVRLPTDPMLRELYLRAARERRSSVLFTGALYQAFDATDDEVRKWSRRYAHRVDGSALDRQLRAAGIPMDRVLAGEVLLVPVRARYRQYLLFLDATSGRQLNLFVAPEHTERGR